MRSRRESVRLPLTVIGVLGALAVPVVSLAAGSEETNLSARLKASSEVGKKGPAGAGGTVSVSIDGTKVCWGFVITSNTGKPTAAHIHKGAAGKAGPVVVPFGAKYKARGCTRTTQAVADAVIAKPGGYYVNVHTKKNPAGAIRGQLKPRGF